MSMATNQLLILVVLQTTMIISVVKIFNVEATRRAHEADHCKDLTADELEQKYRKWIADDRHLAATFYIHPALADQLHLSNPSRVTRSKTMFRTLMLGTRECPTTVNSKSRSIMERSTCPWYLELTYDENRFPMYLANANCKCRHCIGMNDYAMGDEESRCKELTVKEKVLRRKVNPKGEPVCKDGKAEYELTWENIAIGCTCEVKRKTKQSERTTPQ